MTDTAIQSDIEAAIESVLDAELYELPATYSELRRYMQAAIDAYLAASGIAEDAKRLDSLQDVFVKGDEFLIQFCVAPEESGGDCDAEEHPHFEAFDSGAGA